MTRTILIIMLYLGLALVLQIPILSQFQLLPPTWLWQALNLLLLPLAGILIGLLRGEIQGMFVALAAACLFGFSEQPGQLGASIVSFSLTAYLAGWLARMMRLQGIPSRWFVVSGLLLLERLVSLLIRHAFWGGQSYWETFFTHVSWPAVLLTALLGSYLYKLMATRIKLTLYEEKAEPLY